MTKQHISFDRKQHTSIKRLLDGYQSLRPPDKRIKLSSSQCDIRQIFIHCVVVNKYASFLPGCAMLIGYILLLRIGEVGC